MCVHPVKSIMLLEIMHEYSKWILANSNTGMETYKPGEEQWQRRGHTSIVSIQKWRVVMSGNTDIKSFSSMV